MVVRIPFKKQRIIFDDLADIRYEKYLKSENWQQKRAEIIVKSGFFCQKCDKFIGNRGKIHHISYDNLFNEVEDDLSYLCDECHDGII
jgi:5-methylcytosine-specific restriction endonuclease McrA